MVYTLNHGLIPFNKSNTVYLLKVYHISRNQWLRMETRTVKNVCAPAALIEDKIYIIGGESNTNFYSTIRNKSFDRFLFCPIKGTQEG